MKIAYLGKIQLSDVDLSYLHAAQNDNDVTYIIEVSPRFRKGPAFNIAEVAKRDGVFKAVELYPEFRKLEGFIDLDKFFVINTYGRLWAVKSIWYNFVLLLFLMKQRFNVVHLVWPLNIYEFALYVLRRKMILTVHDPFPHNDAEHDTFIVRLRRRCAFFLLKKFIILNKSQRQRFLDFYSFKPADVFDSRLSVYDYLHTIHPEQSLVPAGKYILFAGKISQYKGVDFLLQAMEAVHNDFPDVKLVIAGGGKFHFDISPYLLQAHIDIRNRFIPDEELVALIMNAQFVICPYTNATQSGVIMSAFAFSKPVVATRVGGLAEMLGNGTMGRIVEPSDAKALSQAIGDLLGDENKLAEYSHNISKTYGCGEMSWQTIANEISIYYKKI